MTERDDRDDIERGHDRADVVPEIPNTLDGPGSSEDPAYRPFIIPSGEDEEEQREGDTDADNLFGASSFCGAEDPERPGWRCVMAPGSTHEGRAHVYGKGIDLGTVAREPTGKPPVSDPD